MIISNGKMGKRKNINVVLEVAGFGLNVVFWVLLFIFLPLVPFSYFLKNSFLEICNCVSDIPVMGVGSMILQIEWPTIGYNEVCACKESLVFRGNVEFFLLTMLALYIDIKWVGNEVGLSLKKCYDFLFG